MATTYVIAPRAPRRGRRRLALIIAVAAFGLAAPAAGAETFEVNSAGDPGDGLCSVLEGDFGDELCTLRDAILAANTSPGADEIHFDFPENENETVTIEPQSPLPPITEAVKILGNTHSGPDQDTKGIELDGSESDGGGVTASQLGGSDGLVVSFNGGPTTIRGLAINGFPDNGILLLDDDNTIAGNYIGTNASGDTAVPNARGINVESAGNTIGGTEDADRNVISGNDGVGVLIEPPDIGDLSGEEPSRPQGRSRDDELPGDEDDQPEDPEVVPDDPSDGGSDGSDEGGDAPDPDTDETVSGDAELGTGVSHLIADTNVVSGNYIGTDADGTGDLGNGEEGVVIENASGTAVGADSAEDGNRIAFNGGTGVTVQGTGAVGNQITRNSIFSNSDLGIDLDGDGTTPNETGDGDTGGNNRQNFPELLAAEIGGGATQVEGALPSTPSTSFQIEFFSDQSCDPPGSAEGRDFLGAQNVTTDATGNASFSASVATPAPGQGGVTATATNLDSGDTSEFSNCVVPTEADGGGGSGGSDGQGGGGSGGGDDDEDTDGLPTGTGGGLIASMVFGNIYVKPPGARFYRLLMTGETIPLGSTVNAIHGRVRISVSGPLGQVDTAEFFGGAFLVTQAGVVAAQTGVAPRVIELRLIGGDFSGCTPVRRARAASTKAIVRRARRRVWGSGRGRFRTTGRYAAATVRGTVWRTDDRCDGTLIAVRAGVVSVYDRVLRRTVLVRAGHAYLARSRPRT